MLCLLTFWNRNENENLCVYKHRSNTLPYSEMEKNMAHIKTHKHVPGKKRKKNVTK